MMEIILQNRRFLVLLMPVVLSLFFDIQGSAQDSAFKKKNGSPPKKSAISKKFNRTDRAKQKKKLPAVNKNSNQSSADIQKKQQSAPEKPLSSTEATETTRQISHPRVSEIQAAGTFNGDLRQLPPIKPQQQERPQRQAPPIKPRKLRRESLIKPDR